MTRTGSTGKWSPRPKESVFNISPPVKKPEDVKETVVGPSSKLNDKPSEQK